MNLIEQLERATEGSRELDARIHGARRGWTLENFSEPYVFYVEQPKSHYWLGAISHYTTSLDAKLPGENIVSVRLGRHGWTAIHQENETGKRAGEHRTPGPAAGVPQERGRNGGARR